MSDSGKTSDAKQAYNKPAVEDRKGQDMLDRTPAPPERQPASGENPPPVVVQDVND
jgi:hypothetical protein